MKSCYPRLQLRSGWMVALLIAAITTPVIAETPNFNTFKLSPGFEAAKAKFAGFTGGSFSLSSISNRDRDRNLCIGFADLKPDYVMVLEKDFSRLQVLINSGGNDTTLLIKGVDDKTIRCGDDTGKNKDASIDDQQWKKGTYHIWVGGITSGAKYNYTLTVKER